MTKSGPQTHRMSRARARWNSKKSPTGESAGRNRQERLCIVPEFLFLSRSMHAAFAASRSAARNAPRVTDRWAGGSLSITTGLASEPTLRSRRSRPQGRSFSALPPAGSAGWQPGSRVPGTLRPLPQTWSIEHRGSNGVWYGDPKPPEFKPGRHQHCTSRWLQCHKLSVVIVPPVDGPSSG